MPIYSYTAITNTGEKVSGSETAENERQLAGILKKKGYLLTTAKTDEEEKRSFSINNLVPKLGGVSITEKLLFTRNLQVMVEAGIPLPKALAVLAKQAGNKRMKSALLEVQERVVQGETLSDSIGEYPGIFPEIFVNMVKVGEESGTLEKVLEQLSLQLERQHDLHSKILGALMYPAVIIFAMISIGTLMLMVVVPQLAQVFEDLNVELPLTTRSIIVLGNFVSSYWYIVIPSGLAFFVLLWRLSRTKPGKRIVDEGVLHIPVLSGIVRKANAALMTRTLSSLITSGVPIVRGLEITSRVVGNVYFQESLDDAAKQVGKGAKISDSLQVYSRLYPVIVIQMLAVGEETGETGKILKKLAEFFEDEVASVTKNLTSIIEPLLMLVVGAVVGFFAISMVQPMYSMLAGVQ